ncbi:hypothetical protein ANN_05114 [Periplaneta americana]|uniref:Uncharacterized protein n=1 Tax=Periplaneta americana TaxID=6978 RepID=A0ABQ8TCQ4_PERAM|nr:hypothetical protein ANN_05114 [Periplaneta americana]
MNCELELSQYLVREEVREDCMTTRNTTLNECTVVAKKPDRPLQLIPEPCSLQSTIDCVANYYQISPKRVKSQCYSECRRLLNYNLVKWKRKGNGPWQRNFQPGICLSNCENPQKNHSQEDKSPPLFPPHSTLETDSWMGGARADQLTRPDELCNYSFSSATSKPAKTYEMQKPDPARAILALGTNFTAKQHYTNNPRADASLSNDACRDGNPHMRRPGAVECDLRRLHVTPEQRSSSFSTARHVYVPPLANNLQELRRRITAALQAIDGEKLHGLERKWNIA